jgi:hypothetical protein
VISSHRASDARLAFQVRSVKRLVILVTAFAAFAALPATLASAAVLYRSDFNGAFGTRPNQAVWRSLNCPGFVIGATCADARARLDGAGHLSLDVTPNQGAFIGTFAYGSGWPPTGPIRASWAVPFTLTARLKMPTTRGIWTAIWLMSTNRSKAQGVWELDAAEPRSSLPTTGACFQHFWRTGVKKKTQKGTVAIGGAGAWHTYRVSVRSDRTLYTVDGKTCVRASGVAGRFGLLIDSLAGRAGTWQTNFGPAMTSGTARSKVDYVEVSR